MFKYVVFTSNLYFQFQLCFAADDSRFLDVDSTAVLRTPLCTEGAPEAGRRVKIAPPEFQGTDVFHTLYLPDSWTPDGERLPIVFEYTGNFFPRSGSTGEPEDAGLGYGLSGGKYIWVSLPYISEDHQDNAVKWWGDASATVAYAKQNVPAIIQQFNADPNAVFLCGFSRGAIGVNYIGLHDDEIAGLWDAFMTHDHFDGVRQWQPPWGAPLAKYRSEAAKRLLRVGDRPYLVSQNGSVKANEEYVRSVLSDVSNFTFSTVSTLEALGPFPNEFAKHTHTDRWLSTSSPDRQRTWEWVSGVVQLRDSDVNLGQLIFEDCFERSESQEVRDEPGNEWTTSSDKTAAGNKQVDLRSGTMHIFTHAVANHATSVRHAFEFENGTLAIRFLLHSEEDSLKLNFTDMSCKTVHAGHLFNVEAGPGTITLLDRKTGEMNLEIRKKRAAGELTDRQKLALAGKKKSFPAELEVGRWHDMYAHVDGDRVSVELNGAHVAEFRSPGFAHPTKTLIRLLVPNSVTVDDLRIWRR